MRNIFALLALCLTLTGCQLTANVLGDIKAKDIVYDMKEEVIKKPLQEWAEKIPDLTKAFAQEVKAHFGLKHLPEALASSFGVKKLNLDFSSRQAGDMSVSEDPRLNHQMSVKFDVEMDPSQASSLSGTNSPLGALGGAMQQGNMRFLLDLGLHMKVVNQKFFLRFSPLSLQSGGLPVNMLALFLPPGLSDQWYGGMSFDEINAFFEEDFAFSAGAPSFRIQDVFSHMTGGAGSDFQKWQEWVENVRIWSEYGHVVENEDVYEFSVKSEGEILQNFLMGGFEMFLDMPASGGGQASAEQIEMARANMGEVFGEVESITGTFFVPKENLGHFTFRGQLTAAKKTPIDVEISKGEDSFLLDVGAFAAGSGEEGSVRLEKKGEHVVFQMNEENVLTGIWSDSKIKLQLLGGLGEEGRTASLILDLDRVKDKEDNTSLSGTLTFVPLDLVVKLKKSTFDPSMTNVEIVGEVWQTGKVLADFQMTSERNTLDIFEVAEPVDVKSFEDLLGLFGINLPEEMFLNEGPEDALNEDSMFDDFLQQENESSPREETEMGLNLGSEENDDLEEWHESAPEVHVSPEPVSTPEPSRSGIRRIKLTD